MFLNNQIYGVHVIPTLESSKLSLYQRNIPPEDTLINNELITSDYSLFTKNRSFL